MLPPYSRLARGLRVRTAPGRLAHGKDHLGSFREGQCRNRVVSLPGIVGRLWRASNARMPSSLSANGCI